MTATHSVRRATSLVQGLVVLLVPHGGQHTARRNAWVGMSGDAARGRDRREAQAATDLTAARGRDVTTAYAPGSRVRAAR